MRLSNRWRIKLHPEQLIHLHYRSLISFFTQITPTGEYLKSYRNRWNGTT